jgi:hypothetical protein
MCIIVEVERLLGSNLPMGVLVYGRMFDELDHHQCGIWEIMSNI